MFYIYDVFPKNGRNLHSLRDNPDRPSEYRGQGRIYTYSFWVWDFVRAKSDQIYYYGCFISYVGCRGEGRRSARQTPGGCSRCGILILALLGVVFSQYCHRCIFDIEFDTILFLNVQIESTPFAKIVQTLCETKYRFVPHFPQMHQ